MGDLKYSLSLALLLREFVLEESFYFDQIVFLCQPLLLPFLLYFGSNFT